MAEKNPGEAVLAVDDDAQLLGAVRRVLSSGGIRNVVCTDDSRQVMQIVRDQEIAVALLDLSMPHLTGEDLLRALKEEHPSVMTIIVTGNNEVDKAVECMRAGAFDYLVKPVENQKLIATVKRAIEIRELRMEIGQFSRHLLARPAGEPAELLRHRLPGQPDVGHLLLHRGGGPHPAGGAHHGGDGYRQGAGGAGHP